MEAITKTVVDKIILSEEEINFLDKFLFLWEDTCSAYEDCSICPFCNYHNGLMTNCDDTKDFFKMLIENKGIQ